MISAGKRLAAILTVLWCMAGAVMASEGYPWWMTVTPTPTAGYFRLETSYGTNSTTTVVRLYGDITNMVNVGRTATVYFASTAFTNTFWTESASNSLSFTGRTIYVAFNTNYASGGSGLATNAVSGLWQLDSDMQLISMQYPQAWQAGLWKLNDDGSVSPSGNEWYDSLWVTNASGDIQSR